MEELIDKLAAEVKVLGISIHTHRNGQVSFNAYGSKDTIDFFQARIEATNQLKSYEVLHNKKAEKVGKEQMVLGVKKSSSVSNLREVKMFLSDSNKARISKDFRTNLELYKKKRENFPQFDEKESLKDQIKEVHNIFD